MLRFSLKRLALILLILSSAATMAQDPFREFKVTHWDSKKGMPNDQVLSIFETSDGFIWLTGYFGLARFDGAEFSVFNSKTEPLFRFDGITSVLAESSDTALWIPTTGSGLLRYKQGKFQTWLKDKSNLTLVGTVNKDTLILSVGNSSQEFIVFNAITKKFNIIPPRDRSYWMLKILSSPAKSSASNNIAAIALGRLGLPKVIYRNGVLDTLGEKNGIPEGLYFNSMLTDSKRRTWFGADGGVFFLDNEQVKPYPGMSNQSISPGSPSRGLIVEDNNKGIWVGAKDCIAYLPDGATTFSLYPNMGQTGIRNVLCMMRDREGNIWAGTDRGVHKFTVSKVINFAEKDGFTNSRMAGVLELEPNRFLIASRDNRLHTIQNNKVQPFTLRSPDFPGENNEIFHLYKDAQQNIWIACNRAVAKINAREEKLYKVGSQVRMVTTGIDGRIYFVVTTRGVGYINEQDSISYLDLGAKLTSYFLSSLRQRKDGSWVLTSYNEGIVIGAPGKKPLIIKQVNGIPGVPVFSSFEDKDGTLWFPTGNGIARLKNEKLELIGAADGIPDPSVFNILEDKAGNFWLPGNYGVMKVKKSDLVKRFEDSTYSIPWTILDEADGLANRQTVGARHSIISSDGKLMIPGIGGLIVIDPSRIRANTEKPLLAINQLTVDDQPVDMTLPVTVSPGDHRYVFSYSALSFIAPEKLTIKFRMKGYDKDWITSKGDRRAIYTNLPPGDHVFEIMAANSDGVWTDVPKQFFFTVKPLFYQTLWFRALALLSLLGLVWLIVRWRTAATRKQNLLLEQEVDRRTEQLNKQKKELEHTLGSLKSTQAQLIQSEKMASLGELTAGIAHEIQNPLNFVNNFSSLNKELIDEAQQALNSGDLDDAKDVLGTIADNEDKILHHGKRADAIVKGMLQHSRTGSGVKEPTNINALADEYLRLAYHGLKAKDHSFNAGFKTEFDPNIGNVNVVAQDIGRVLLNLISNAFYAVNEKKKTAEEGYIPEVIVKTAVKNQPISQSANQSISQSANQIIISVRDNGFGIPEANRNKIFQPFFTTKPTGEGTGLGLSLSYDIIKAHGGDITVESQEGEASTFMITLPA